jgi:hypothetical protein
MWAEQAKKIIQRKKRIIAIKQHQRNSNPTDDIILAVKTNMQW